MQAARRRGARIGLRSPPPFPSFLHTLLSTPSARTRARAHIHAHARISAHARTHAHRRRHTLTRALPHAHASSSTSQSTHTHTHTHTQAHKVEDCWGGLTKAGRACRQPDKGHEWSNSGQIVVK